MNYFKRFLIVFVCGIVQILFAAYSALVLYGVGIDWHINNHIFMFIPGILIFVSSGILTASYYLGDLNTKHFDQSLASGGLIIRQNIDKRFAYKAEFMCLNLKSDERDQIIW